MIVTEQIRPDTSPSTSALGPKRVPVYARSLPDFEDIFSVSRLPKRVAEAYPLSFSRAQDLLDWVRQQEIARLDGLLRERAASFGNLNRVLIEQREGTVDLLFVISGDLYSGETVVLGWIQDFREALQHVELDFVVVPSSVSSDAEWSRGAKVLYERGARSPGQG